MTHPVPAGHQRLPGFAAPGTRPKAPSATVGVDTTNERHFMQDALDSLVHKIQRVALFSGDIEKNFRQILDHTKAANEVIADAAKKVDGASEAGKEKPKKAKPEHTSTKETGDVQATLRQASMAFGRAPARTHDGSMGGAGDTYAPAPWQHHRGRPVQTSASRAGRDRYDTWHPGQDRPLIAGLPGDVDWEGREHGLNHMDFKGASDVTSNWSLLRQHTAQRLNQKLSERTPAAPYRVTSTGRLQYATGHPDAGKFVRREELAGAKEEMAHYSRGLNRMASIQGAINNVGRGEGLAGALGAVGTKLGWVGAAYGATMAIGHQFESQRAKNAYYQEIYGGSNVSGFKQRFGEESFARFKMFGTMSGDQARALYKGVSQIGLQGEERQSALDFAVRNYRRTGLNTEASVDMVRAAVKNGVSEFSELGTQLDLVAKAAKQAGINVGEAQKQFTETYKMVSTNIVTGSGTASVAGGLQAAQSALGEGALSRLSLPQLAGDPVSQRLQATALGMSPLTYANQLAAGGAEAGGLQARGMSAQLNQAARVALSAKARARLEQLIAQGPPPENQADFDALAHQLQREGLLNTLQAQQALSGYTRQNIDQASAGSIAVASYLGAYQTDINNTLGQVPGQPNHTSQTLSKDEREKAEAYVGGNGDESADIKKKDIALGYYSQEIRTGVTDSYAKRLIDKKMPGTQQIRVKDGDKYKWVSLAEAFSNNDYYDQIASGDVQMRDGDKGEPVNLKDKFADDDAAKARSKATGETKGKIEIYATPELRRLFGFNYYGGDEATGARAQGVPAPASGTPTSGKGS